jgi:hypothetical protein
MSSYNPVLPQDLLLAIGQRLRVEYDDIAEPVPPRLTALLKLLEMAAARPRKRTAGPLHVQRLPRRSHGPANAGRSAPPA